MQLGMIGLGRMGGAMVRRLRAHGHDVLGYAPDSEESDSPSLADLVARLEAPRTVWSMVPAGAATDEVLTALGGLLDPGDVVVDGGNSDWRDTIRRGADLASRQVDLVDAGVSGGVWGEEAGYSLMVGGDAAVVARLRPAFDDLAPEGGFAHVGPLGAGHFTKMVHNGVEYGMMQAYAEGFELLSASPVEVDVPAAFEAWRHGSVVRSWLLDLLVDALADDPALAELQGYAEDSGEARWAVREAVAAAVPVPVMSAALYARFVSRQEQAPAMRVVAALRQRFGGHTVRRP